MRVARSVIIGASLSFSGSSLAAVPPVGQLPVSPSGSTVAPLASNPAAHSSDPLVREIARLGDESFQNREDASRKLWGMGHIAIPRLREAARSPDPEVAKRAAIVLRKLELDVTPETAPEIQALVERYNRTAADERVRVMFELRQLRAWQQILKLHALEKDPEIRTKIHSAIEGVAVFAAREALVEGKTAEARGYLEMSQDDSQGLLSLAEFHRTHGSLKSELAKKSEISPRLLLALLRVSGDFPAARAQAIAQGEMPLANTFAMLEGDPLPWLLQSEAAQGTAVLHGIYQTLAEKRWKGEKLTAQDLEVLEPYDRGGDDGSRRIASSIQFLLGQTGPAEATFAKISPINAFRHFDLLERMPEAYRAIGLDPDKPDFASWIAKRFDRLVDENDDSGEYRTELITMASFLERRGLLSELKAYDAPLAKLAGNDGQTFVGLLRFLYGGQESGTGALSLAKRATESYAADDDLKWEEIVKSVFGESEEIRQWWSWLSMLQPTASRPARMDAMLALFRFGSDPGHLRDLWLKRAWKAMEEMPKEDAAAKLQLMIFLASASQDLATGLKAWDQIETPDETSESYGFYLSYLSAVNRWEKAGELWLKLSQKSPTRAELHAYAASSLRRAGKTAEAAKEDDWADKLALADPITCVRVGQGYAYGGDYARASRWWERALVVSQPGTKVWQDTLAIHALDRLQESDWKRAAALHEVMAELQSGNDSNPEIPGMKLRIRANADLAHAMAILPVDRERAIASLKETHHLLKADGSLADYFFPALRKAGLIEQHDAWFEESWQALQAVLKAYPACENTQNTTAWMASRAVRHLDEAEALVNKALLASPGQAAYLDTKAEIYFARKDRKRAVELSSQSLASDPVDDLLRRQYERYRSAPFPVP